jgi:HAMP domain-containing protein
MSWFWSLAAALLNAGLDRFMAFWSTRELGRAEGREQSDTEHSLAAQQAADAMQAVADKPADEAQLQKRLDEGSA